ncbi:hypothetical protein OCO53_08295 [Peribacillus frigoritolerans]|uniref:hypothetical protein n=1 Tax=Peribacillus frigoritolerans TaxID=450367 RepID=UPI0021D12885|nr:hypothetical protein [Peribacillus frigoritolerans]MCU6600460.1 hypothetical protein [Peribacillus frigoritolerans]
MDRFCFVVIDYYSISRTIKFIEDLSIKMKNNIQVVVIDNSKSEENFRKLLENVNNRFKPCTKVYKNEYILEYQNLKVIFVNPMINLGFAKGNNFGAEIAKKYFNHDYLIFSNNDILIKNLNLEEIESVFEEDYQIAILGIKQEDLNGRNQNPRRYIGIWRKVIIPNFFSLILNERLMNLIINDRYNNSYLSEYKMEVDWVSGAFMIIRQSDFLRVKGFDENTFLYAEELIISRKINAIDKKTVYYSKQEIIHEHGGTTKKQSGTFIQSTNFNSHYYYYEKYVKETNFNLILAKASFLVHRKINYKLKLKLKHLVSKIFN